MERSNNTAVTYDSDMQSADLDHLELDSAQKKIGLLRLILCSAIGIFVFFVSVPHNGDTEIVFSIIYNKLVGLMGNFAYWVLVLIIAANFVCHLYYKYIKKEAVSLRLQRSMITTVFYTPCSTRLDLYMLFYMP